MQISSLFNKSEEIRTVLYNTNIVSSRHVGIELEVENARELIRRNLRTRYWAIKGDSSLRNNGVEFVLRQPLAGEDLYRALHELAGIMHKSPELNVSERTSLHVHVDCRDLDMNKVRNVLATYVAAESALYMLGGKERYDNIYCPGVTSALEQMNTMRMVMHGGQGNFVEGAGVWCKYTGINLHPLHSFGSIEFRAHEGTVDVTRIREWVNILLLLFTYAEKEGNNPTKILRDAAQGPDHFIEKVFKSKAPVLLRDGVYVQYWRNNLLNLKDLLRKKSKSYKPTKSDKVKEQSSDLDSIISAINEALGE